MLLKKNIKIALVALLLAGAVSCARTVRKETGFILGYYDFEELQAVAQTSVIGGKTYIKVEIRPSGVKVVASVFDDDPTLYAKLSERNQDTKFQTVFPGSSVSLPATPVLSRAYPVDGLESIELISHKEWDTEHVKNGSMEDIARFVSVTVAPYIKKGYVKSSSEYKGLSPLFYDVIPRIPQEGIDASYEEYPLDKLLQDVTSDDLLLCGPPSSGITGGWLFVLLIPDSGVRPAEFEINTTATSGQRYSIPISVL